MANNIDDPNSIYPGQTLIIPAQDYDPNAYTPRESTYETPTPTLASGKQIVVDISDQRVYAFENGALVRNVLVSTGVSAFPTVQGDYHVYLKYDSQTMSGPGYYLPGVPGVMYFYQGYSLHGTYWHSNWGTPMSHGCVNMPTPEANWIYNWAPMGTAVHVQW
jgi:lipoprotein-anchoring transpeptidase ErfK/SrfK